MKKRFLNGILVIVCLFAMFLSGCNIAIDWVKDTFGAGYSYESGDFKYCYGNVGATNYAKDSENIIILGLTSEGKTKERIIIPEIINKKTVVQIGMAGVGGSQFSDSYANYKRLYLPSTLENIENGVQKYKAKIFLNELKDIKHIGYLLDGFGWDYPLYLSNQLYNEFIERYGEYGKVSKANLEYVSDGKVYFIDDYEDGQAISYPPPIPTKEGYAFGGWYTEQACLNEWDFENDLFSLSEGEDIKCLYAKWQEINN